LRYRQKIVSEVNYLEVFNHSTGVLHDDSKNLLKLALIGLTATLFISAQSAQDPQTQPTNKKKRRSLMAIRKSNSAAPADQEECSCNKIKRENKKNKATFALVI